MAYVSAYFVLFLFAQISFLIKAQTVCNNIGDQTVGYDPACSTGESFGCNAGGQGQNCRFCGFSSFPPCKSTNQPTQTNPQVTTNNPTNGVSFTIINSCPFTIWPGIQGKSLSNPGWKLPFNGGWELRSGDRTELVLPRDLYANRFWARTGCKTDNGNFNCETGNCGPWLQCAWDGIERGGATPATLAEFTLNGWGDQDYYDVSLVDGYNLQVTIRVKTPNSLGAGQYWCTNPSCTRDLNNICPSELQKKNAFGQVIGCLSACERFNTDAYCCRNAHGTPDTCKSSTWPVNYPSIFKIACPTAYSYAYDDTTSTFFCKNTGYEIKFC